MRKSRVVTILLTGVLTLVMSMTGFAQTTKLDTPTNVKWEEPGSFSFTGVPESEGEYFFEVTRDGDLIWEMGWLNLVEDTIELSIVEAFEESGDYQIRVQATGDYIETEDSDWSNYSAVYTYQKPDIAFGIVRNVTWDEQSPGVVSWDPPANIPSGYEDSTWYQIDIMENGKYRGGYGTGDTSVDITEKLDDETAVYEIAIRVLSLDIEGIAHGDWTDDIEVSINVSNGEIKEGLEQWDTASPSNAQEFIEGFNLENLALGMQTSDEIYEKIEEIEQAFLDETGKEVKTVVGDGVDLSASDITVVGAGLNIASDSNAVKINIAQPDEEADVSPVIYSNVIQFDIHLTGAMDTLICPVTITMPIPDGIKASRLVILHYKHSDNSYEEIWPIINGNWATFTVTEFSIFAFAEKREDIDEDDLNEDALYDDLEEDDDDDDNVWTSTTSTDVIKGQYDTVLGIITGSGSGYSQWEGFEEGTWKLRYADGTYAQGSIVIDADGIPQEQVAWELIDGKWYCFGADGYAKEGLVYDYTLVGYFYIDIHNGMLTGWNQINGAWYYFNTTSDGTKGMLALSTIVDGYEIDEYGQSNRVE